jgi:hypothetical protein
MTSVSGYSPLPDFLQRLSAGGFEVVAQARASPSLSRLAAFGVFPACQGQTPDEALETLIRARRLSPKRLGVIYRSVRPEASLDQFATFLRSHTVGGALALHPRTAQLYVSGFQLLCGGWLIIGPFVLHIARSRKRL